MFSTLRSLKALGTLAALAASVAACSQSATTATCGGAELACDCPDGQIASASCVDEAVVCDCIAADAESDTVDLDSGDQDLSGFDGQSDNGEADAERDTDDEDATCAPRPWWIDGDGDGFGDGEPLTTTTCDAPEGYADAAGDCDNNDAFVYPGATEFCDGLDNNCNGQIDERNTVIQQFVDADGDGFGAVRTAPVNNCARLDGYATNAEDCDDNEEAINPDAIEACDGVDNNCDGFVDEEAAGSLWWPDFDSDGFGDAEARPFSGCEAPDDGEYVDNGDDCDDSDETANPDATEVCNLRDDDCDGSTDEGTPLLVLFADNDNDSYGDAFASPRLACEPLAGFVANREDCNDADGDISPIAAEVCNAVDDDCDLLPDNGAIDAPLWYPDVDGDGFGAPGGAFRDCSPRGSSVLVGGDCDDRDPASHEGAAELCDDRDNNCDGAVDEGVRNACGRCGDPPPEVCGNGIDDDCDGQRDETADGCFCDGRTDQPCYSGPAGTLGVGICRGGVADCLCPGGARFCSDGAWGVCETEVLPSVEICDGLDNNCDGIVDEGVRNACGDCGPAPLELCDGLDNNCNGVIDEGLLLACGLCPDAVAGRSEECGNGLDDNCDGLVDEACSCTGDIACYPGSPETRAVGLCRDGAVSCYAGSEASGVCAGAVLPSVELCNGEDDNCDGVVDIGANGCSVCGVAVETCDGVDNDCDGTIDEGVRNTCGTCLRDVLPEETGGAGLCNGIDDDCDGLVDEGLRNACGTCGETCYTDGRTPAPGDLSDDGATLIGAGDPENPTGVPGVTLARETFIPPFVWIANHDFDTVTRFSTETYREEGRYWVGNNPSRTAVDLDGNMWVGGRDDGRLTKILWDTSTCPDRNSSGSIETSRVGALGPLNSIGSPFTDECVVYSAVPNAARPSIRGIAAGPDGRVWIGYTDGGVQSIHPYTFELGPFYPGTAVPLWVSDAAGQLTPRLNPDGTPQMTSGGGVYGLVIDSRGQLYISTTNRDRITRFDTNTGQWIAAYTEYQCGSYGIAVDGQNRIWTGGWPRCRGVGMFDPATNRYHNFTIPNGFTMTSGATTTTSTSAAAICGTPDYCVTGIGVEPATGDVWASFYAAGWTGRLRVNDSNLAASVWTIVPSIRNESTNALLSGVNVDLRGVGFDARGYAWTLGLGSDRLFRIDPATNRRTVDLPNGAAVGQGSHYTYSDFTGSTTLSFTAPRGFWRSVFDTGFAGAQLDAIDWSGSVPAMTTAELRVRALGADGAPLSSWIPAPLGDGTPVYIAYPTGAASATYTLPAGSLVGPRFEIEVRMTTSDPDVRPVITGLSLRWQRP